MLAREKLNGALDTLTCREGLNGTIEFSELRCNPGAELSCPQSREQCFHVHAWSLLWRPQTPKSTRFYRPGSQALSSKLH